ncbi:FtsK/SpoIIIE domain-containing protein [Litorihabitans aurantiacus]|uniref:FtsK domain-containing protein n=1 Tax=Litorihabitans aurantiacus TaxID=1930061 RepID=A0AA37XFF4_9MICO|nr:FtsK/SpoIIIE domain-containing protein [Litorihabitans aurantiacus]GMA32076.1 hypothetical protein GCM10025875_20680 [Litorihabitans aurantiacus]
MTSPSPTSPTTADVLETWRACWRAPSHLAVTHGPDAGWVVPLTDAGAVTVGRRGCDLEVADSGLDRHHLSVRRTASGAVEVRDERSEGGTLLVRAARGPRAAGRRRRRLDRRLRRGAATPTSLLGAVAAAEGHGRAVSARWRALRVGDVVLAGSSRLELRAGPAWSGPPAGAREDGDGGGPAGDRPSRRGLVSALTAIPAVVMLVALAAGGVSPALRWVVLGAVALSVGVSLVVGLVRRRPSTPTTRPGGTDEALGPRDPAALAVCAAGLGRLDRRWSGSGVAATAAAVAAAAGPEPGTAAIDGGTVLASLAWRQDPAGTDGDRAGRAAGGGSVGRPVVPGSGVALTGPGADAAAAWWRTQLEVGAHDGAVLTAPDPARLPRGPWILHDAAGRSGVARAWCRTVAAALTPSTPAVEAAALLGHPTARTLASRWASGPAWAESLTAPLGVDEHGRVREVDLVGEGPHALVAGTTGSGKSELLQAWVLALAMRHPPSRLHLLLVDYKGGATFAAAARLPHTVGLLTDLDGAASDRALAALRAELRRREHLVTAEGVRGVGELRDPPARLLVVVDELRALVEDSPTGSPTSSASPPRAARSASTSCSRRSDRAGWSTPSCAPTSTCACACASWSRVTPPTSSARPRPPRCRPPPAARTSPTARAPRACRSPGCPGRRPRTSWAPPSRRRTGSGAPGEGTSCACTGPGCPRCRRRWCASRVVTEVTVLTGVTLLTAVLAPGPLPRRAPPATRRPRCCCWTSRSTSASRGGRGGTESSSSAASRGPGGPPRCSRPRRPRC